MDKLFEWIKTFFGGIYGTINDWMVSTFKIDQTIFSLYDKYISNVPELFKILGIIVVVIIFVLGVISFAKKFLKLLIVLAIVAIVVLLVTGLISIPGSYSIFQSTPILASF
jgi:hypothetical protein